MAVVLAENTDGIAQEPSRPGEPSIAYLSFRSYFGLTLVINHQPLGINCVLHTPTLSPNRLLLLNQNTILQCLGTSMISELFNFAPTLSSRSFKFNPRYLI